MASAEQDKRSRFKLAQLWHIINDSSNRKSAFHRRTINEILQEEFNVNHKVTLNLDSFRGSKNPLYDCTALHFTYYNIFDIHTFKHLIKLGADFTIKNGNGQTALHLIITEYYTQTTQTRMPFINTVLSAHVNFQNSTNPHDNNGFSHLHAACIANHVEAVQLFLDNGASVNESVNNDVDRFGGYTPLHYAAKYHSFEVAQMLINRGANVNALTAKGESPLDYLIIFVHKGNGRTLKTDVSKREQMINLLLQRNAISGIGLSTLHMACSFKDVSMAERLLDEGVDVNYAVPKTSSIYSGYTALRFALDGRIDVAELLLKRGAKMDIVDGYGSTSLDVCINTYSLQDLCKIFSCIQRLKAILLSDGDTVLLDLIAAMGNLSQFKLFLENKMKDTNAAVPLDSSLWPGCTILHLSVIFSKQLGLNLQSGYYHQDMAIVEECLNRGLGVNVKNAKGQTPIHLAFSKGNDRIVNLVLQRLNEFDDVENLVDEDNLSYLHIACAMKNEPLVEKLLANCDPNITYRGKRINRFAASGSTPLHAAAVSGSRTVVQMLMEHGADFQATDENGLTPIHWLLQITRSEDHATADILLTALAAKPEDRVVDGLSYLHVACCFNNVPVVQKLLDLGSNVNGVIEYDKNSCDAVSKSALPNLGSSIGSKFTPLQMAIKSSDPNEAILSLLLRHGADVFVKGRARNFFSMMLNIPLENGHVLRCLFQALWDRDEMRKAMDIRLQLTRLHVACYLKNEQAIRIALNEETDINARVPMDSVIFAGCTPLHLLMAIIDPDEWRRAPFAEFHAGDMINLLVDRGADVTVANAKKETPVHLLSKNLTAFRDQGRCKHLLLNAQKDYSVNPVNTKGVTHFHLACSWLEVEAVQKFLENNSVDVNQPIDYFLSHAAGYSPLHLSLSSMIGLNNNDLNRLSQMLDLLLKYGADVAVEDVAGETALHRYAETMSPEISIFDKLVSFGADVKKRNLRGQNAIEKLTDTPGMASNPSGRLKIFQKYQYNINSWDRLTGEGFIAKIFTSSNGNLSESSEFKKFTKSPEVRTVDDMGRTAIHNSVSISDNSARGDRVKNYIYAIESFMKIGIKIDHQDKSGKTALHCAVRMENCFATEALLAYGPDVNITDKIGKSALSYAKENSESKQTLYIFSKANFMVVLRLHIMKLLHLKIEVSQLNQDLVKQLQCYFDENTHAMRLPHINDPANLSKEFFSQVEKTKTLNIKTNSLTLFDFLSETGAVSLYPFLLESERESVDDFFKSIDHKQLKELSGVIKLQCRKMAARLSLIHAALDSIRTLLGFSIPGLCEQISRFLSNSDLNNLIAATI